VACGVWRVGWVLTTSNQQLDAGGWLRAARGLRAFWPWAPPVICRRAFRTRL